MRRCGNASSKLGFPLIVSALLPARLYATFRAPFRSPAPPPTSHRLPMRVARFVIPAIALIAASARASAQTPASPPLSHSVTILPATRLATLGDSLPAGAMTSVQVGRWEGLTDMLGRRDSNGVPERHDDFTDIFVVQRGTATLRYGGTTDGAKITTAGEWRGGTIRNGTEALLSPGDVVVIPTGIPHQLLPTAGQHFVYLTFKVAKEKQ